VSLQQGTESPEPESATDDGATHRRLATTASLSMKEVGLSTRLGLRWCSGAAGLSLGASGAHLSIASCVG